MDPKLSTVHLDQPLTNFSLAYMESEDVVRVAQLVFPPVAVPHLTDKYFTFGKEGMLLVDTKVGPKGEPAVIEFTLSSDSYACERYALRGMINLINLANQDAAVDLELATLKYVMGIFERSYEYEVASMCVGTSPSFSNGYDYAVAGDKWSDYVNSDPLGDIEDAIQTIKLATMGKKPNLFILCDDVWTILKLHPDIVGALAYQAPMGGVLPKTVSIEAFASLIGIDQVVIADSLMIDALLDNVSTATPSYVWAKGCFMAYVEPGAGLMTISAGKGFNWSGLNNPAASVDEILGAGSGAPNVYKWDKQEDHQRFIQVERFVDPKVTCDGAGYYFTNVIA